MTETAATAADLSGLPAPQVLEPLDYEAIYAAMLASLQALVPNFDATVESDPAVKLLQFCAYRELLLRACVDDAARAVMPAFARGSDLDQLAALMGITRHLLSAGDPSRGIPPTDEDDDDFRRRLVLAPEGFSAAGPAGAYVFHALSADHDVLDASAISPAPGDVLVATVGAYLSAETRRPLTKRVRVRGATIAPYVVKRCSPPTPAPTPRPRSPRRAPTSPRTPRDAIASGSTSRRCGRAQASTSWRTRPKFAGSAPDCSRPSTVRTWALSSSSKAVTPAGASTTTAPARARR